MGGPGEFPATQWSLVLRAGARADTSQVALESLARTYWNPLYAYLRRDGHDVHAAEDLLQGFFARLLAREDLATVAPAQGRFRSYLLAGLRNFLVSEARREQAQKRGGRHEVVALETERFESELAGSVTPPASPEVEFDRRWARTILERALDRLRAEHAGRGKGDLYDTLKPGLLGESEADYARLGQAAGLTPGAVAVAGHRQRHRLREIVRLEVAQTVGSAAELDEEMRHLLRVWTL
jgi:RNA polymerase sigma-70 factor (ECF subfamily)